MSRMEAKIVEITLGETICEKLKILFFDADSWPDCYKHIADKFTKLKRCARHFYAGHSDVDILRELIKYNTSDLEEIMDII